VFTSVILHKRIHIRIETLPANLPIAGLAILAVQKLAHRPRYAPRQIELMKRN
jgi:hypothetical protein